MANLVVPKPKENGLYSKILPKFTELAFIDAVREQAAHQGISGEVENHAGKLLFIIGAESREYSRLPKWPQLLSTLQGCEDYVNEHVDRPALLAQVHLKSAYAWLCENGELV